jgi:hypothetical protein
MAVSHSDRTILGADVLFVNRVRASLVVYANGTVIGEAKTTAYNNRRYPFAISILTNPDSFKQRFAFVVATDTNVINDATGSGATALTTGNVDTQQASVTDAHMDTAVTNAFNSFINVVQ